ncbi:unnamed protein product [Calypogeia fissa]
MMKRSGANGVVHDNPVSQKEHYVPVSKIPEATKVIWHVDPAALVGPREEEARRKAPEAKYLYAISTLLTIMVLWGVFRHVHFVIPQVFSSSSAGAREDSLVTLGQIESDASGFHGVGMDSDSVIGGRRAAKHLLEVVHTEQFLAAAEKLPLRRVFRPHKEWNKNQNQQQEQAYYTRPGAIFGLRRRGST